MPPDFVRRTIQNSQTCLKDCDPIWNDAALNSILDQHWQEHNNFSKICNIQENAHLEGSYRIIFYDKPSCKVKELIFSAEEDFDVNILNILKPGKNKSEDTTEETNHDSDPVLCEATLQSIYAQGNSELSLQEKQELADNVRRAFSLSGGVFREVKARAVKATRYRKAQIQAHLKDLHQDKGWSLKQDQFENSYLYRETKLQELKEISGLKLLLQMLPSFAAQVQVSIISMEDLSTDKYCIKKASCYGRPDASPVYCTVKLVSADQSSDEINDPAPDHITKTVIYIGRAEWHDKSPWIPVSSADDQLCIKLWRKKSVTRLSKGSGEVELISFLKHGGNRKKKITWNGDTFLGQVVVPMNQIESQALSSGSIRGSFPLKSYNLRNSRDEKLTTSLEMEISFYCELLLNDPAPDEKLLRPPVSDVEAGYEGLVHVAYGMHISGEFELENTWKSILSCYENYFRLRKEVTSLIILKHLATLFQPEAEYLKIIVRDIQPLCKLARQGKLNKSEYDLLGIVVSSFIKPSINALEDFQSILSLRQPGALRKLIELLCLLLSWDANIKEVSVCISRWVKVSCVQRFNKHLTESSTDGEITSRTFSKAISLLQKDMKTLQTWLKDEAPEQVELLQTCAMEYYRLVSQYIIGIVGAVKISSGDFEDLTRELSLFHKFLQESKVEINLLDLHSLLHDHILELVQSVKPRLIDWVACSLSDEKWEPLSVQTRTLFSSSVVDLYFMINGVVENLTTRLSYFPFGKFYYSDLEESISSAVQTYLQMTEKSCVQELLQKNNDEGVMFFSNFKLNQPAFNNFKLNQPAFNNFKLNQPAKPVCISKTLCVKMNNIHAVLQQQTTLEANFSKKLEEFFPDNTENKETGEIGEILKLDSRIAERTEFIKDKKVGHLFKNLHGLAQTSLKNITSSIVETMQNEITERLQKFMEKHSAGERKSLVMEDLHILTVYLDDHLKILNEWLDPDVFRCLLPGIVGASMFSMEEFVLNRNEDHKPMTSQQRDLLEQTLNLLYDYFYGDGVGVSKNDMDWISRRLNRILQCWDLETHELCMLYWKAWDRFNGETSGQMLSQDGEGDIQLHVLDYLLLLQQREDDEAQIIVANQKLLSRNNMTPCWKDAVLKPNLEAPREMLRGVAQYLKTIQTPSFPPLNVSYSPFQTVKGSRTFAWK